MDDYRSLAEGFLRQNLPQIMKTPPRSSGTGEVPGTVCNRPQANIEEKKMQHLAKEMDIILSSIKPKSSTDELLHLFKRSLSNFVNDKRKRNAEASRQSDNDRKNRNRSLPVPGRKVSGALASTAVQKNTPKQQNGLYSKHKETKSGSPNERNHVAEKSMSATKRRLGDPASPAKPMELTKMNNLHRCTGNLNVKALQAANKIKTTNAQSTKVRSPPAKAKQANKMASKVDKPATNHQMKTIYENEQYIKTADTSIASSTSSDVSVNQTQKSEQDLSEAQINKELTKEEFFRKDTNSDHGKYSNGDIDCIKTVTNCTLDASENSLVQRMTTFWNQKLNTSSDAKSETSSLSLIGSSVTSVDEYNQIDKNVYEHSSEDNVRTMEERIKKNNLAGVEKYEIPPIKLSLMDELVNVLKRRTDTPQKTQSNLKNSDVTADKNSTPTGPWEGYEQDNLKKSESLHTCNDETLEELEKCLMGSNTAEKSAPDCRAKKNVFRDCINTQYNVVQDDSWNEEEVEGENMSENYFYESSETENELNSQFSSDGSAVCLSGNYKSEVTVYDIVSNLQNLIRTVETIPKELKALGSDLYESQSQKDISHTLTVVVEYKPKLNEASADKKLSFSFNNETKQATIGYRKIEFLTCTCYFPSTFTRPTFESHCNPMHLVLFPERYDYLKSITEDSMFTNRKQVIQQLAAKNDEMGPEEGHWENGLSQELLPFCITTKRCSSASREEYSYVMKMTTETKSTVFCVSSTPVNDSVLPVLNSQKENADSADVDRPKKVKNEKRCKENKSSRSLNEVDWNKKPLVYGMETENGRNKTTGRVIGDSRTPGANAGESSPCNSFLISRRSNSNGLRRRRFWQQTNVDEENLEINGGSGDYGITVTIPCHRTSSMNVTVSSSILDSTSQPDIGCSLNGSEQRLTSLPGTKSSSFTEVDNFSVQNVIRETSEECLYDRDGFLVAEDVRAKENPEVDIVSPSMQFDEPKETMADDSRPTSDNTSAAFQNMDINREDPSSLRRVSYAEPFVTEIHIGDIKSPQSNDYASSVHASSASLGKFTDMNTSDGSCITDSGHDIYDANKSRRNDCTLLYSNDSNFTTPEGLDLYDLDNFFQNEPNLKKELTDTINLNCLSDREKKILNICMKLLRYKTSEIEQSLSALQLLIKNPSSSSDQQRFDRVKNKTSDFCQNLVRKICFKLEEFKKKLVAQRQSQAELLLSYHYSFKQLVKIVYTLMITVLLCFLIQKKFCGFLLPVCFPW